MNEKKNIGVILFCLFVIVTGLGIYWLNNKEIEYNTQIKNNPYYYYINNELCQLDDLLEKEVNPDQLIFKEKKEIEEGEITKHNYYYETKENVKVIPKYKYKSQEITNLYETHGSIPVGTNPLVLVPTTNYYIDIDNFNLDNEFTQTSRESISYTEFKKLKVGMTREKTVIALEDEGRHYLAFQDK